MATSSALTTRHRIDEDFIANVPPAQVMKGEASAPSASTLTPSFAFGNKRLVTNCRMACGPAVDYSSASPWPPRWDSGGQAPQPPWTDQPCPVPRPPGCIPGRPVPHQPSSPAATTDRRISQHQLLQPHHLFLLVLEMAVPARVPASAGAWVPTAALAAG